jgi:uncharacterized membrane protein (DUF2068 family)
MSRASWALFAVNLLYIPWNVYWIAHDGHWLNWAGLAASVAAVCYQLHVHRFIKRSRYQRGPTPPAKELEAHDG